MKIHPETDRRPHAKAERSAVPGAGQALLPLLAGAAVWVLATRQVDPAAAAESRFLALWIAGVLSAAAVLAPRLTWETGLGAVLAPVIAWALPQGPHRGAAISLLLATVLTLAACRRWQRRERLLDLPGATALCLGTQLLARSDLVLAAPHSPRALAILLTSAVASAVALALIADRSGERRTLYVGAATLLLGAGWTVTGAGVLLAIAAGCWLGKPGERRFWVVAGCLPVVLWNPLIGLLAAAAMLTLAGGWWRLAPALALAIVLLVAPPAAVGRALNTAALGLALIPTLAFAERRRYGQLAGALALCCAGGALDGGLALLPGVALAGLALPPIGVGARLQGIWMGFAAFCGVLTAAYPWLDARPVERVLGLVQLESGLLPAVVLIAAVSVLGWILIRLDLDRAPAGGQLIWLALFSVLWFGLPPAATVPLDYQAVALDSGLSGWQSELGSDPVGRVSVDCNLVNGVGLARDTPVLTVLLLDEDDQALERWTLTSGHDTAEWAAARPDVANRPGFEAPPPWLGYVAPEGSFFGQRYRSRLATASPRQAARLVIRRAAELAPEVTPVIYRVELQP